MSMSLGNPIAVDFSDHANLSRQEEAAVSGLRSSHARNIQLLQTGNAYTNYLIPALTVAAAVSAFALVVLTNSPLIRSFGLAETMKSRFAFVVKAQLFISSILLTVSAYTIHHFSQRLMHIESTLNRSEGRIDSLLKLLQNRQVEA